MTQYIDKSAVVAEIEKEKVYAQTMGNNDINSSMQQFYDGMKEGCNNLLNSINTFETKVANFEKVFNDEYSKFSNNVDAMDYGFPIDLPDYKDFAKHFFELGLNARIRNI